MRMTEEEYAALMARRGTTSSVSPCGLPPSRGPAGPISLETVHRTVSRAFDAPKGEGRKYRNQPVVVDGIRFDSKHEAEVYGELMLRRRAGELWLVLRQVKFDLPGGIVYVADFLTVDSAGRVEVLDAKSPATAANRTYINKKKQIAALWGVAIREV